QPAGKRIEVYAHGRNGVVECRVADVGTSCRRESECVPAGAAQTVVFRTQRGEGHRRRYRTGDSAGVSTGNLRRLLSGAGRKKLGIRHGIGSRNCASPGSGPRRKDLGGKRARLRKQVLVSAAFSGGARKHVSRSS